MTDPPLLFKRLDHNAYLPTRATNGSAGYDLYSKSFTRIYTADDYYKGIHTGVSVCIPRGMVGLIRGRSGLSRDGLITFNGTIDSDYRGEVVIMLGARDDSYSILFAPGDRIAQLVIVPHLSGEPQWVDELPETDRGSGGFGSTGK